jgi:hypothetical protein
MFASFIVYGFRAYRDKEEVVGVFYCIFQCAAHFRLWAACVARSQPHCFFWVQLLSDFTHQNYNQTMMELLVSYVRYKLICLQVIQQMSQMGREEIMNACRNLGGLGWTLAASKETWT